MEQNKTGKYLKYAIGEILLVVIGILIALQLNNWNEERKTNSKETMLLKEMVNSIDNDLSNFKNFYWQRLKVKKNGLDSLNHYCGNRLTIQDSTLNSFINKSQTDILVTYNEAAFDVLKSTGLEVIQNDTLRALIIRNYQTLLPLFKELLANVPKALNPTITQLKLNLFQKSIYQNKNKQWSFSVQPKVENILNHQDFIELLSLENRKYVNFDSRLNFMESVLTELKESILEELKKQ